jgi:transposase-like protein
MAKKLKRPKTVRASYAPEVVMTDFRTLMQAMPHMNEDELRAALVLEVSRPKSDRRNNLIELLHRRIVNRKIQAFKKSTDADLTKIKTMRKEAADELSSYLS